MQELQDKLWELEIKFQESQNQNSKLRSSLNLLTSQLEHSEQEKTQAPISTEQQQSIGKLTPNITAKYTFPDMHLSNQQRFPVHSPQVGDQQVPLSLQSAAYYFTCRITAPLLTSEPNFANTQNVSQPPPLTSVPNFANSQIIIRIPALISDIFTQATGFADVWWNPRIVAYVSRSIHRTYMRPRLHKFRRPVSALKVT